MTTALFLLLLVTGALALARYARHDRLARPRSDDPTRLAPTGRHFVSSMR